MDAAREVLASLRRKFAVIEAADWNSVYPNRFTLGLVMLDGAVGGGLPRAALHEVFVAGAGHDAAARGFGLALALRASADRGMVWVRQDMAAHEQGELHAPGLAEFGTDPSAMVLVRVRDALQALRAGHEVLRCSMLGSVVIETWGTPKALDLTATRRLAFAAAQSGVTAVFIRSGAGPQPSAAFSRWSVRAAPSVPLAANTPGAPIFDISLLRHRAGFPLRSFRVEWDCDGRVFREPALSRAVAAAAADRPAAPDSKEGWRRAG